MKAALIIFAVITCLALAGLFIQDANERNSAIEQSNRLVMTVTSEMLTTWDPQTVRDHATDDLLAAESPESLRQRYTPMSRRLGDLQEIFDIQYDADIPSWWQSGDTATVSYHMRARFETEIATIAVELVRQQGQWLIKEYQIQPPAIAS